LPAPGLEDQRAVDSDVELQHVTKRFGSVVAVDDVSLRIAGRSFTSLLGPSGCGKTTTLRMIAGFEQPSEGEILIGEQAVAGIPPYRRNVNTVFQHYALFPHMDVERNIGYGLRQSGVRRNEERRRVAEALELVRLTGYEKRRTWELSGGQQQRVALARALVNRPTVLLLDEPLGALDLKLRKEMQLELKSLQHEVGITFIYVTHDQEEAITMSDTIVVMRDGRIQQAGRPADLYERPRTRYVAGFLGASNFIPATLREAGEGGRVVVETRDGRRLGGRLTDLAAAPGTGAEVTIAIRPERIEVRPANGASVDDAAAASASTGEATLDGRISESTYLGDQREYRVDTAVGTIVARRQNSLGAQATAALGPGDPVRLSWHGEATLVLGS
jgi:spermidine/putrescine transport system ATP-binding protein